MSIRIRFDVDSYPFCLTYAQSATLTRTRTGGSKNERQHRGGGLYHYVTFINEDVLTFINEDVLRLNVQVRHPRGVHMRQRTRQLAQQLLDLALRELVLVALLRRQGAVA